MNEEVKQFVVDLYSVLQKLDPKNFDEPFDKLNEVEKSTAYNTCQELHTMGYRKR